MKPLLSHGSGSARSWRWNAGNGSWKSMGQIPFPTIRNRIHLRRRSFAGNATKCSIGKAGRAVRGKHAGYGSAVNGIRWKACWDAPIGT